MSQPFDTTHPAGTDGGTSQPAALGAPAFPGPPPPPSPPSSPSPPWSPPPPVPPASSSAAASAPPPTPRSPRAAIVTTALVTALVTSAATAGLTWAVVDADADADTPVATQDATPAPTDERTEVRQASTADPDWSAVADAVRPSVVAIAVMGAAGSGEGSGVIIDAEGHVITNDHVVSGAQQLQVTLSDGRVYDATIVGTDPTTDLAVIAITDPPDDLEPATLGDSDSVDVGDPVMAVGNPLGLASTVTTGIVSALDRPVSTGSASSREPVVTNAIQVDAAINPGNSGGPLFDAEGQVIGVTSSIATLSQAGGQAGSIGLGFAIPANLADLVADQLLADGSAEHSFLGVYLSDGTATVDGTSRLGAVVEEVGSGSPAADADLRAGDVVVAINGEPVSGGLSLTASVREHAVGDTVTLTVVRDGKAVDVDVTFTARQEAATGDDGR